MNEEAAGGAQDWRERRRQLQDAVERHMIRYIGDFPPFFVERAEGSYFFDDSGRRILDFTSGQMCATLGHNHPDVVAAIAAQLRRARCICSAGCWRPRWSSCAASWPPCCRRSCRR